MNLVNGLATKVFDIVMWPLELLGLEVALVIISGIFGVLALVAFKQMSSQKGIAFAKDKIKGHMIEIRIYQDDLPVVGKAVGKILMRNFQYMGLNFLPFIPLSIPFVILLSQLVVRYGFEPMPPEEPFTMRVELASKSVSQVRDLEVIAPDWVDEDELVVVRGSDGKVFVNVRDAQPGKWDFQFRLGSGEPVTKQVVIGPIDDVPRAMQPDRVGSFWEAWLWPAEKTLASSTGFDKISIVGGYPMREFWWLPAGPAGIVIGVLVYSMVVGAAALKPLGVTI